MVSGAVFLKRWYLWFGRKSSAILLSSILKSLYHGVLEADHINEFFSPNNALCCFHISEYSIPYIQGGIWSSLLYAKLLVVCQTHHVLYQVNSGAIYIQALVPLDGEGEFRYYTFFDIKSHFIIESWSQTMYHEFFSCRQPLCSKLRLKC